jgi:DNA-binding MarR family transcriptional regulator
MGFGSGRAPSCRPGSPGSRDPFADPQPCFRAFLDAALEGTDVTADGLEALRLIRRDGDRYELAFSVLTRKDREKIQAVAEREGRRLADGLLARRATIEGLLTSDRMPGVDWHATGYFILGCVSLDWDGLNLVREKGYLTVPAEGDYLPTAYQPLPREDVRRLYWGSHSYHDPAAVTTFGDHYSLPRSGLPDVLWRLGVEAPEPVRSRVTHAAEGLVRRHAAALMLVLRDGAKSASQLAAITGFGGEDVQDVLDLLVALDYVTESDGTYGAVIPVLTERDRPMVRQLRLLGRQVMREWFAARYEALGEELGDLTPRRFGVPLSNSFYWVWHPLFGVANRDLVSAGSRIHTTPGADSRASSPRCIGWTSCRVRSRVSCLGPVWTLRPATELMHRPASRRQPRSDPLFAYPVLRSVNTRLE